MIELKKIDTLPTSVYRLVWAMHGRTVRAMHGRFDTDGPNNDYSNNHWTGSVMFKGCYTSYNLHNLQIYTEHPDGFWYMITIDPTTPNDKLYELLMSMDPYQAFEMAAL